MADLGAFGGGRVDRLAVLESRARAAAGGDQKAVLEYRRSLRDLLPAELLLLVIEGNRQAGEAKKLQAEVEKWRGHIRTIWATPTSGFERIDAIEAAKEALDTAERGDRPRMLADADLDPDTLQSYNRVISSGEVEQLRDRLAEQRARENAPDSELRFSDVEAMMRHPLSEPGSDKKGKRRRGSPNADTQYQRFQATCDHAVQAAT